jgi:hypothetical protein
MTRSMLRGIRVSSKKELKDRMSQYIDDMNETPTIFKWKYKMDGSSLFHVGKLNLSFPVLR